MVLNPDDLQTFDPLFDAVGCVCLCEGEILLLKRVETKSYPGYWGIPSGKVETSETSLKAMIRELYEETGVLLSADNLKKCKTYNLTNDEFSFVYTTFLYQAMTKPTIKVNANEHSRFAWFSPDDALRLQLIPDLDNCLRDIFPSINLQALQLDLFTGYPTFTATPTHLIEQHSSGTPVMKQMANEHEAPKRYFVSLGPPGGGKSSFFKAMRKRSPELKLIHDNTALRQSSNLNFFLRKAFFEEERLFFFHFQLESLFSRFKYTLEVLDNSLVDETIYTTLAYSRALYRLGWIKDYEYEIFYKYYTIFFEIMPRPTKVFYLDADTDVLIERMNVRGHAHEKYYTFDYVDALREAFSEVAKDLSDTHKIAVVTIDSTKLSKRSILRQYGII